MVGNLAWRCYPVIVDFPKIIPNTPNDHSIGAINIRFKSKQDRYDYSECAPGTNGTF